MCLVNVFSFGFKLIVALLVSLLTCQLHIMNSRRNGVSNSTLFILFRLFMHLSYDTQHYQQISSYTMYVYCNLKTHLFSTAYSF